MPNRLIAHLAHVEVLSPKPEESLRFFCNVAMPESMLEAAPPLETDRGDLNPWAASSVH